MRTFNNADLRTETNTNKQTNKQTTEDCVHVHKSARSIDLLIDLLAYNSNCLLMDTEESEATNEPMDINQDDTEEKPLEKHLGE